MKSTAEGDSAVQMLLDCLPEVIRFSGYPLSGLLDDHSACCGKRSDNCESDDTAVGGGFGGAAGNGGECFDFGDHHPDAFACNELDSDISCGNVSIDGVLCGDACFGCDIDIIGAFADFGEVGAVNGVFVNDGGSGCNACVLEVADVGCKAGELCFCAEVDGDLREAVFLIEIGAGNEADDCGIAVGSGFGKRAVGELGAVVEVAVCACAFNYIGLACSCVLCCGAGLGLFLGGLFFGGLFGGIDNNGAAILSLD